MNKVKYIIIGLILWVSLEIMIITKSPETQFFCSLVISFGIGFLCARAYKLEE